MNSTGIYSHPQSTYHPESLQIAAWPRPVAPSQDFQDSQTTPSNSSISLGPVSPGSYTNSVNETHHLPSPRSTAVRKKSIDRNRKPCGNCSSSKRKCKLISTNPHLCERCKSHGLSECPPHISWTKRKASVCEGQSPLEKNKRLRKSRSQSLSYADTSESPLAFDGQRVESEHIPYQPITTTPHLWAQTANTIDDMQSYSNPHMPTLASPSMSPCSQQEVTAASLFLHGFTACPICQTPFNQMLYAAHSPSSEFAYINAYN